MVATQIDDKRLLPCPFCGEPAAIWYFPQHDRPLLKEAYYVGCTNDNCGCELDHPGAFKSLDDAVSAWNRRAKELITKNDSSELEKNSKKLEKDFGELVEIDLYSVIKQKYIEREALDKIRAEIETKYGQCDICEYFEDFDYEENDISEYRPIGNIADILQIIDKYKAESEA